MTKTQDIADDVAKVVAIAPPTHGTTFAGLFRLANPLGVRNGVDAALATFGCVACTQLSTGGSAVATLEDGPIAQEGVDYAIVTSRFDELVTPTDTAFVRSPVWSTRTCRTSARSTVSGTSARRTTPTSGTRSPTAWRAGRTGASSARRACPA